MYDFEGRLKEFGTTPEGVGWGSKASQEIRFAVLVQLVGRPYPRFYSLTDIGCGYGALLPFLHGTLETMGVSLYVGLDIHQNAIDATQDTIRKIPFHYLRKPEVSLHVVDPEKYLADYVDARTTDYVFASGVLQHLPSFAAAKEFLRNAYELCTVATVVNALSIYNGKIEKDHLLYDPGDLLKWGMSISGSAVIDHSYLPHDCTLIMYRR